MKIFKVLTIISIMLYCNNAKAQDYQNSISLNTGFGGWGVTYKHMLKDESAFGGSLLFYNYGSTLQGYRSFHTPLNIGRNYKWFLYYGYGAHIRRFTKYDSGKSLTQSGNDIIYGRSVAAGLDGIIGFEYRLIKYPFSLGASYNPNFEFGGPRFFNIYGNILNINISVLF